MKPGASAHPEAVLLDDVADFLLGARQVVPIEKRADLGAAALVDHPLERVVGLEDLLDPVRGGDLFEGGDGAVAFTGIEQWQGAPVAGHIAVKPRKVRPRAAAGPSARTPSSARGPSRRSRAAGLLALPLLLLSALLFAPRLLGPAEGGPLLPGFSKGPPARAPGPAPVPVRFAAPPDVRLLVDGRELSLGVSPEPVPLAPGTYRIEARWPDGRVARRDLRVAPLPEGAVLEIRAPGAAGAGAARLGGSVAPGAAASRRAPGPGGGS